MGAPSAWRDSLACSAWWSNDVGGICLMRVTELSLWKYLLAATTSTQSDWQSLNPNVMWILSPLFMYQKGNQRAMKKACRDALEWGCRDFDWEIFADVYGFQICSRIAGTFLPGAGSIPGHGRKERRGRAVRFGCQEDVPWTTKMLVRGVVLVWEVGKLNKKQVSWDLSDHKILSCFALSTNTLLFSAFAWNPRDLMLQGPFFC